MNSQNHEFVRDVCKHCGVSRASAEHFRWPCKDVVKCLFCQTPNRIKDTSARVERMICGKCKKPLFVERATAGLDDLIGLANVKSELRRILAVVNVGKERIAKGFKAPQHTLHFVFQGAPGTGKTEVARVLAANLKAAGYLSKGQLIETDKAGLVGKWLGHTEEIVTVKCNEALGGVLFIDEAYSLSSDKRDVLGKAAIDTLLKFMEDHRQELVVIVAGYPDQMAEFIRSNPGLKSRFTRYIDFPDYSAEELCDIFYKLMNDNGYYMKSGIERDQLVRFFKVLTSKGRDFGNARGVRTLAETLFAIHAERINSYLSPDAQQISEIVAEDFIKLSAEYGIPAYDRGAPNPQSLRTPVARKRVGKSRSSASSAKAKRARGF